MASQNKANGGIPEPFRIPKSKPLKVNLPVVKQEPREAAPKYAPKSQADTKEIARDVFEL